LPETEVGTTRRKDAERVEKDTALRHLLQKEEPR
jgi:hypothetical protein